MFNHFAQYFIKLHSQKIFDDKPTWFSGSIFNRDSLYMQFINSEDAALRGKCYNTVS